MFKRVASIMACNQSESIALGDATRATPLINNLIRDSRTRFKFVKQLHVTV